MLISFISRSVVVGTLTIATATTAYGQSNSASARVSSDEEEVDARVIIVTASKREESLQDVPSSITALTDEQLERLGVERIQDYAALVPGLTVTDGGTPGTGTVILRGLNSGNFQTTPTAAYYIDEAPFTGNGLLSYGGIVSPDPELADVARIEVLKGPQATLYGASNLGGLVRLVSKKPDLSQVAVSGRVDASTVNGGGEGYGGRIAVNLPLQADKLGLRVVGTGRHLPGWADNRGTGRDNVNEGKTYGTRAILLWRPGPDIEASLSGMYSYTKLDGANNTLAVTDTTQPRFGEYVYNSPFDGGATLEYYSATATVDYDVGPGSFILAGTYAHYATDIFLDYTNTYSDFLPFPAVLPGYAQPKMDKYSGELRFVSDRIGAVEFLAGAFYTSEDTAYEVDLQVVDPTTLVTLPPPQNSLVFSRIAGNYEEIAAFANLTFYLSESLDIQGGYRLSHNEQDYISGPNSTFFVPSPAVEFADSDTNSNYMAAIRWRPSPNVSTYARVASGYRPGGPVSRTAPGLPNRVEADTVWNYEVGIKGQTADGGLSVALAAYHIDWTNVQLNSLFNGLLLLANGGKAEVDGVELEATLRPIEGLTVGMAAAYTDARLTSVPANVTAGLGASASDPLPYTPKIKATVTSDYRFGLSENITMALGGTVQLVDERVSGFPLSGNNPSLRMPSYLQADIRAGIEFEEFHVRLRAENLFNSSGIINANSYKVSAGQAGTDTILRLQQPRTITLSLGFDF